MNSEVTIIGAGIGGLAAALCLQKAGIKAGIYEMILTDRNGCIIKNSYTVKQPSKKMKIKHSKKDVSCFNGDDGELGVMLSGGTPDYSYNW